MFPYLISHLFAFEFNWDLIAMETSSNKHLHIFTIVKLNFQQFHFILRFFFSISIAYVCKHSIYSIFDIHLTPTFIYYVSTIEMGFIHDGFPNNILVYFEQFYNCDHVRLFACAQAEMPNAWCLMPYALCVCLLKYFVQSLPLFSLILHLWLFRKECWIESFKFAIDERWQIKNSYIPRTRKNG